MSRYVTSMGPEIPNLQGLKKTYEYNPAAQGIPDESFFDGFPWMRSTKAADRGRPGTVVSQLKNRAGNWVDVYEEPYFSDDMQVVINGEMQRYVFDYEIAEYNLPDLETVDSDGNYVMHSVLTPSNFEDLAITGADRFGDYEIVNVNKANRTIQVKGLRYSRGRPSDNGQYPLGNYFGLDRFSRDELVDDPDLDQSWKRKKYAYGIARLQPRAGRYIKFRYESIQDSHSTEPRWGRDFPYNTLRSDSVTEYTTNYINEDSAYAVVAPNGVPEAGQLWIMRAKDTQLAPIDMTVDFWNNELEKLNLYPDTTHTFKIMDGDLTDSDWDNALTTLTQDGVVKRSKIKLIRRLPWISKMRQSHFAQKYGVWSMRFKLADHRMQFHAWWLWGQYLKFYGGGLIESDTRPTGNNAGVIWLTPDGEKVLLGETEAEDFTQYDFQNFDNDVDNNTEVDLYENPCAGGGDTRVHNAHYPDGGMEGYVTTFNLEPVIPEKSPELSQGGRDNREWDRGTQAGHIMGTRPGDDGYVVYTDWTEMKCIWWPPGNPYGKPANSFEWYIRQADSGLPYRRTAGVVLPPSAEASPGLAKRMFLNAAVGGDYCNATEFIYARNQTSTNNPDSMSTWISGITVEQFPDYVAGGYGYPDSDAQFTRGFLPSPGDYSGGSGSGVVPTFDIYPPITFGSETLPSMTTLSASVLGDQRSVVLTWAAPVGFSSDDEYVVSLDNKIVYRGTALRWLVTGIGEGQHSVSIRLVRDNGQYGKAALVAFETDKGGPVFLDGTIVPVVEVTTDPVDPPDPVDPVDPGDVPTGPVDPPIHEYPLEPDPEPETPVQDTFLSDKQHVSYYETIGRRRDGGRLLVPAKSDIEPGDEIDILSIYQAAIDTAKP